MLIGRSLQAVDPVLSRGSDAGRLGLQLCDLSHAEGTISNTSPARAMMITMKTTPMASTRGTPTPTSRVTAGWMRKAIAASEHKGAEEVAKQVEDDDRHDERGEAEDDLEIATSAASDQAAKP